MLDFVFNCEYYETKVTLQVHQPAIMAFSYVNFDYANNSNLVESEENIEFAG